MWSVEQVGVAVVLLYFEQNVGRLCGRLDDVGYLEQQEEFLTDTDIEVLRDLFLRQGAAVNRDEAQRAFPRTVT